MAIWFKDLKVRPYGNVEDIAKLVNEGKLAEAQALLEHIIDICNGNKEQQQEGKQ